MNKNDKYICNNEMKLMDFLLANVKNKSRNNIKSLLSYKQITVNGTVVTKYDYLLRIGDEIALNYSVSRDTENDKLNILYEDEYIIAVDKPYGILSIATKKEKTQTMYHMLYEYEKQKNKNNRIYVVHRLDKDTSGVFIVAKDEKTKKLLQDNWENVVNKGYIAIVEGVLKNKKDVIKSYLKETSTFFVYSSDDVKNGKLAITEYEVAKENSSFSMLKISLKTGRKNQIRVHMSDNHHPIIGDKKYNSTKNPLNRLGLHAYELSFYHPITEKLITINAKVPNNFNAMFSNKNI